MSDEYCDRCGGYDLAIGHFCDDLRVKPAMTADPTGYRINIGRLYITITAHRDGKVIQSETLSGTSGAIGLLADALSNADMSWRETTGQRKEVRDDR